MEAFTQFSGASLQKETGEKRKERRKFKPAYQQAKNLYCTRWIPEPCFFSPFFPFFFPAQRTKDLYRKREKVGPFECDELEKPSRVGARRYPITVHTLLTMAKENKHRDNGLVEISLKNDSFQQNSAIFATNLKIS